MLFPKMLAQIDAEDVSEKERSDDNGDESIIRVVWTNIGNVIQCITSCESNADKFLRHWKKPLIVSQIESECSRSMQCLL